MSKVNQQQPQKPAETPQPDKALGVMCRRSAADGWYEIVTVRRKGGQQVEEVHPRRTDSLLIAADTISLALLESGL